MSVSARVAFRQLAEAAVAVPAAQPGPVTPLVLALHKASRERLPEDEGGRVGKQLIAVTHAWLRAGERVRPTLVNELRAAAVAMEARLDATTPTCRPRADIDN
jgi:hypothetical protein